MGRHPSDAALGAAANGDWASHATCRNQPDYTSQDPDSITYTCSRRTVATDEKVVEVSHQVTASP